MPLYLPVGEELVPVDKEERVVDGLVLSLQSLPLLFGLYKLVSLIDELLSDD